MYVLTPTNTILQQSIYFFILFKLVYDNLCSPRMVATNNNKNEKKLILLSMCYQLFSGE